MDGQTSTSTTYATTDEVDEAISALHSMQGPWFLYLNSHAPHSPFHVPPTSLCVPGPCTSTCANLGGNPTDAQLVKAMVEAMDVELARFLTALDAADPSAYVVFIGDNGTPRSASEAPFCRSHAKGSAYEGGVNVPVLVRGPGVVQDESAALVTVADLYATFAELAGITGATATTGDSVSLVPVFGNPNLSPRSTVYTETFSPNDGTLPYRIPPARHSRRALQADPRDGTSR